MAAGLIALRGHRLVVAARSGQGLVVRTGELVTPGGQPLPIASVGTPHAVALLRRTLRPLLAGLRPAGIVVLDLDPASQLLFVPHQAEHRLATIALVLAGGDPSIAARTRPVARTEVSAVHRLLLYSTTALAPIARALRDATGRELPVLDPALALGSAATTDAADPTTTLRVWREPWGEHALVGMVRSGKLAHSAWIGATRGLADDALAAGAREVAMDVAVELGTPLGPCEVVFEPPTWEAMLGPLLSLVETGEAARLGILPLRAARRGATRARWRLVAAALAAVALAWIGAVWSRATLGRIDQELAAHVDAARRAHVESTAAGAHVAQVERAATTLEAELAADPTGDVLAAIGELDPELFVVALELAKVERSAPLGATAYAGELRARFRRDLAPSELAARVAATVTTLGRQEGIADCRLSVVPGSDDPEFSIAFRHSARGKP